MGCFPKKYKTSNFSKKLAVTPPKFNMEPENKSLEKGKSFWKA